MNLHMTIQLALGPWARPGVRYSDDLYGPGILMISNEAGDPVNEDKVGATQLWHRLHSRPCMCVCVCVSASDRCSCSA